MSTDDRSRTREDEFFAKIEFERRQKALAARQKQLDKDAKQKAQDLHRMHCPKCGMEMVEVEFEGIKIDKCSSCLGVFFDNGELDQLASKTKPGYLRRLQSLFSG